LMYADGLGSIAPYLWVPIVPTALALWISYLGSTAFVAIIEGKEKRFIRSAFGKYVSPDVVRDIATNPDALKLGGQKRSISVFFSDLAGFTTMSERMTPEALIAHLNEYLTEMTQVVMDEAGTLDKYIGDAIMAFWNAPNDLPDHADRAMRCAVMTQRRMDELNKRWRADDPEAEDLVVRIGINTGDVVVGNVGGENRFDYSAIGDAVNLGARLEPANKDYDTLTMVSQFTVDACDREAFRLRELDFIAVKGKVEPVPVYELLEFAGAELAPHREEALAHYETGMSAYKNMDWELALTYFEAAVEADPTDGPSKVYLERSRENIADPPDADWDFVIRRTVK
jgi:adenylate cyclase